MLDALRQQGDEDPIIPVIERMARTRDNQEFLATLTRDML
jgi:hypothetical protein